MRWRWCPRRPIGHLSRLRDPLHLAVFDLAERRELLLSESPAVDSVVAAASTLGVFLPVAIGHRCLVDGGVLNNTPISHPGELGASLGRQGVGSHLTLVTRCL